MDHDCVRLLLRTWIYTLLEAGSFMVSGAENALIFSYNPHSSCHKGGMIANQEANSDGKRQRQRDA